MSVLIVRTHFYINGCIPVLSVELSLLCTAVSVIISKNWKYHLDTYISVSDVRHRYSMNIPDILALKQS